MYIPFDLSCNVINFVLFSNSPCPEILSCLLFQLVDNVWVLHSCPVFSIVYLCLFHCLFYCRHSFQLQVCTCQYLYLLFFLTVSVPKLLLYLQIYASVCIQVLPFFGHHSLVGNCILLGFFEGYAQ